MINIDTKFQNYQHIFCLKYRSKKKKVQLDDLVFPHKGHGSIYIGNNQVIHADEGIKLGIKSINKFYTARRIL